MSDTPFHASVIGYRFLSGTMPALIEQLTRLNANLQRIATLLEQRTDRVPPQRDE